MHPRRFLWGLTLIITAVSVGHSFGLPLQLHSRLSKFQKPYSKHSKPLLSISPLSSFGGESTNTTATLFESNVWLPPQTPLIIDLLPKNATMDLTKSQSQGEPQALKFLVTSIVDLQSKKWDSVRLLEHSKLPKDNTRDINSIVFTVFSKGHDKRLGYALAVLDSNDKVNVTRLEQAVVASTQLVDGDERQTILSLAPSSDLPDLCGFAKGTVPPLGLSPAPLVTIVERSLVEGDQSGSLLVGGGGLPGKSTLLPISTLLHYSNTTHVASFRTGGPSESSQPKLISTENSVLAGHEAEHFQKPFFAVQPPDRETALQIVSGEETNLTLQPEWVAVVGRIAGVRQMARRLVFADLEPPILPPSESSDTHPWRSPRTGEDMAVQLVLGKTLCQRLGVDDAEVLMRRLKVGQLVSIQGKTNVGNRDSLRNWITKKSLDIVTFDCQHLHPETESSVWGGPSSTPVPKASLPRSNNPSNRPKATGNDPLPDKQELPNLTMEDIYPGQDMHSSVVRVDTLKAVENFRLEVSHWLSVNADHVGLVGLDCEWKPFFMTPDEPQPVLLFQICIHPLKKVFLLDMQVLARPLLPSESDMNPTEIALNTAVEQLYTTDRLIKVGFQVTNDLQRLAASFPHIPAFRKIDSVLEVSTLAMKILQMQKQHRSRSRLVTSSLSKMTERFMERNLQKKQQTSDWSRRPLSTAQIEYAALDAAVTPTITKALLRYASAVLKLESPPLLQRYDGDAAFSSVLVSSRFIVVHKSQHLLVQRWNAKPCVGENTVVSQVWATGLSEPDLPTLPENDDEGSSYINLAGQVCIPSCSMTISSAEKDSVFQNVIGKSSFKAKDRCILDLLGNDQVASFENDNAKLDFNHRSGFVELSNAVALFVTLPTSDGRNKSRSYPNEWLEDGSIMSWFIKSHEWKNGSSRLAKKMQDKENFVILYARRGKGHFFCCGRCRVVTLDESLDNGKKSDQWSIMKLFLMLMDYGMLQSQEDFQLLVNPFRKSKASEQI